MSAAEGCPRQTAPPESQTRPLNRLSIRHLVMHIKANCLSEYLPRLSGSLPAGIWLPVWGSYLLPFFALSFLPTDESLARMYSLSLYIGMISTTSLKLLRNPMYFFFKFSAGRKIAAWEAYSSATLPAQFFSPPFSKLSIESE